MTDSGLCKIVGDRTSNPTHADDRHLCGVKLEKARFPDLRDGRHSREICVRLSLRHGSSTSPALSGLNDYVRICEGPCRQWLCTSLNRSRSSFLHVLM